MALMPHPSRLRFCALAVGLGMVCSSVALHSQDDTSRRGRKYKAPPPAAHVEVTILKADNGKPITDAHVIFHPIEGDKDKGYLELKTNSDGKAVIDILPIGDTVRLQVIATGFQTYGGDYKVDQSSLAWEVCLKRPGAQYSIYTNHPTSLGASACPAGVSHQKPAAQTTGDSSDASPNSSPAASSDKSDSSASEPTPAPGATSPQPQSN